MTIEGIKTLINDNKDKSKDDLEVISKGLPFFDRINFILWTKKILGIELVS